MCFNSTFCIFSAFLDCIKRSSQVKWQRWFPISYELNQEARNDLWLFFVVNILCWLRSPWFMQKLSWRLGLSPRVTREPLKSTILTRRRTHSNNAFIYLLGIHSKKFWICVHVDICVTETMIILRSICNWKESIL